MELVWGLCLLYIFIQSVCFSIDHVVLPSLWARPSTAVGKHNLCSAVGGGWRLSPAEYWVTNTSSPGLGWIGTGAQTSCVAAVGAGLPTPGPFGLARPCWSRCANAPYMTIYTHFLVIRSNCPIHITSVSACACMGNIVPILAGFMACLLVFVQVVQVCAPKQGVSPYRGDYYDE
jgi:hypothetical protein